MSDQERATSLGSSRKDKKSKELRKTVRITLTLAESNEEACPEFNYRVLLGSAERKRRLEARDAAGAEGAEAGAAEAGAGALNGVALDPYASDDQEQLKDLASHFEEKYGGSGGRKRHGRFEDYVYLGAGYDEKDPFIDNTVVCEEILSQKPVLGGFYINSGPLAFKEVPAVSDADDERDFKVKKSLKKAKVKRTPLRGTNPDHPELVELAKKRKFASLESSHEFLKKKKKLAIVDLTKKGQTVKDLLREKRNQFSISSKTNSSAPESPDSVVNSPVTSEGKKSTTSVEVPHRKPATAMSIDDAIESVVSAARSNEDTSQDSSSSISKSGSGSSASSDNTDDSQDGVIPSTPTIPAATPNSLSTIVTNDLKSSSGTTLVPPTQVPPGLPTPAPSPVGASPVGASPVGASPVGASPVGASPVGASPVGASLVGARGEEANLPPDLPSDLVELISKLKKAAESSAEGKCRFFSSDVNQTLLRVEQKSQSLPCSRRQLVYGHLALYLPCTKDTLMKRAKKLRLNSEEQKLKEPMARLEEAIKRVMPEVLNQYKRQCQKVAEENPQLYSELFRYYWSTEEGPPIDGKGDAKTRIPRKVFPWNPETRALLEKVVAMKRQCLLLQKPRKESIEELLKSFLETSVLRMWPPGWMTIMILLRESGLRPGGVNTQKNFASNVSVNPLPSLVHNSSVPGSTPTLMQPL